jgi:hypothetical protein
MLKWEDEGISRPSISFKCMMIREVGQMAKPEITPHTEDGANERTEPLGVRSLTVGVQQRSTRDLQKCVKAHLQDSIDPKLLERVRREANGDATPNGQSPSG